MAADSLANSNANLNLSCNPRAIFKKITINDILLSKIANYFAGNLLKNLYRDVAHSLS